VSQHEERTVTTEHIEAVGEAFDRILAASRVAVKALTPRELMSAVDELDKALLAYDQLQVEMALGGEAS
jgi:hypothetical protein